MPKREDVLRDETFKEDGLDVGRRVHSTLLGKEGLPPALRATARIAKAVALLVARGRQRPSRRDELDEFLLEIVR